MIGLHRPRARFRALAAAVCTAALGATLLGAAGPASAGAATATERASATEATTAAAGSKVVGYFTDWGVYQRNYHVKNIETSGSADKLTHINYAFGNVTGGKCAVGDSYADYEKAYTADQSVDGVADTWDQPLRGSFNQLRKLKKLHPNLKVIWSFGGWTWSGGFGEAAKNPAAFAQSCYDLVEDPRWADVFDGIDIDWEYPNACGLTCDTSGRDAYGNVLAALRAKFGTGNLVTSAITADGSDGGKLDAVDYGGAAQYVDWYNPMTYDFFGAWDAQGPTAPHSPLTSYTGHPEGGLQQRRRHHQAQGPRRPRLEAAARDRLLRPRLDGRDAGRAGRHGDRRGHGYVRGGHRGLQGPQGQLPGDRHRGRHGVRALRDQLVELRHPGHHRHEDGLQEPAGPGWHVLLGAER